MTNIFDSLKDFIYLKYFKRHGKYNKESLFKINNAIVNFLHEDNGKISLIYQNSIRELFYNNVYVLGEDINNYLTERDLIGSWQKILLNNYLLECKLDNVNFKNFNWLLVNCFLDILNKHKENGDLHFVYDDLFKSSKNIEVIFNIEKNLNKDKSFDSSFFNFIKIQNHKDKREILSWLVNNDKAFLENALNFIETLNKSDNSKYRIIKSLFKMLDLSKDNVFSVITKIKGKYIADIIINYHLQDNFKSCLSNPQNYQSKVWALQCLLDFDFINKNEIYFQEEVKNLKKEDLLCLFENIYSFSDVGDKEKLHISNFFQKLYQENKYINEELLDLDFKKKMKVFFVALKNYNVVFDLLDKQSLVDLVKLIDDDDFSKEEILVYLNKRELQTFSCGNKKTKIKI